MNSFLFVFCATALLSVNYVNGDAEACSADTRPRELTDVTGWFTSLNFPGIYADNGECQWLIRAQPGQIVNIDFATFNTERLNDRVYFFDGDSNLAPVIIGLDGDRTDPIPTGIRSSGEVMFVQFDSDSSVGATGFNATYTSVDADTVVDACSTVSRPLTVSGVSGFIESQFNPDPYPYQCDCQWIIQANMNEVVKLDFLSFWTRANNDWVLLHDGPDASSPLIARLSGNYLPAPVNFFSTQQYMFVEFQSDAGASFRGFRGFYQSVTPPA